MKARILAAAPLVLVCLAPAVRAQTTPPPTGRSAAAAADANGFKIGDRVQILTGFGWIEGTILATRGNDYRVRAQTGIELTKRYPDELRRIGAPFSVSGIGRGSGLSAIPMPRQGAPSSESLTKSNLKRGR